MKVIVSDILPLRGYVAMNCYKWIFWRSDYEDKMLEHPYYEQTVNHEEIHEAQMRDYCSNIAIGGTIFYIVYFFDWLWKVLFKYPFSHKAYKNICFEREAFIHERNLDYLSTRKKFAWKDIDEYVQSIKEGDEVHIVTKWSDNGWHKVTAIVDGVIYVTIAGQTVKVTESSIKEVR